MTEDEARLTRCCGPEGCGGNSANEADRYCIASACMAWRWSRAERAGEKIEAIRKHRAQFGSLLQEAKAAVEAGWSPMLFQHGFCGLAGQP